MRRLAAAVALLLLAVPAAAAAALPNHDEVSLAPANRPVPAATRDGERVLHGEPRLGLPTFLWAAPRVARQGPSPESWTDAARRHLEDRASLYRLDLGTVVVESVHDVGRGPVIVTFGQLHEGLELFRERLRVVMDRTGGLVAISGNLSPHLGRAAPAFSWDEREALAIAVNDLTGLDLPATRFLASGRDDAGFVLHELLPGAEPLSLLRPARIRPVFFALPDEAVSAWHLEIQLATAEGGEAWQAYVIGGADGRILFRNDLVAHAHSYRVWADTATPFTPMDGPQGSAGTPHPDGSPTTWQAPATSPELATVWASPISTQDPWLSAGATETAGNNVDAYADLASPDGFGAGDLRASTSAWETFDRIYDVAEQPWADTDQQMAAITQLFFTTNWLHDFYYDAGFDEEAGNAQASNFDRGGAEGDRLLTEAQDLSGRNNANMGTPADGSSPRMQMYVWDARYQRTLTVLAPTSIAGSYGVATASFGAQSMDVTADVVLANDFVGTVSDGCEATWDAAVSGKIALVDRGGCAYTVKVINAEANGAVGVIVANNVSGSAPEMSGAAAVGIGVLSLSQSDGATLKANLAGLRVRLFREPKIDRDASVDNGVVAHEFGHYLTNRLIADASGLSNNQGRSLGEGWGDFTALLLGIRAEDDLVPGNAGFAGTYAMGTWVSSGGANRAYYYGIRRVPYSVDLAKNALTLRHIANGNALPVGVPTAYGSSGANNAEVHASGEVWATMLWECQVALLNDARYTFEQARLRMRDIYVASLKITPSTPTFLEARDAVLAAAWAFDPADHQLFVQAFARRGAGLRAVAPDRWSTTHAGVVESTVWGNELAFVEARIEEVDWCDHDGVLDAGESGRLEIVLQNVGAGDLAATTATVSTTMPGITLGNGGAVTFPASRPFDRIVGSIDVSLSDATAPAALDLHIDFTDPALAIPGTIAAQVTTRVHASEEADASATDDVECQVTPWTATGDPSLFDERPWSRVELGALDHRWLGPASAYPSDLSLVSPPLQVSGNLTLSFRNRHDFEINNGGRYYDGGVIEITEEGTGVWTDVGATLYGGTLESGGANPLNGRPAVVGRNASYPALDTASLDLGGGWAGKTVRLRFRIGTDEGVGREGWELDDIAVGGIDNLPFPRLVADTGICVNRPPVAVITGPAEVDEATEVVLDGSGSSDKDGDPLTFEWRQTDGPAVAFDPTAAVVRFTVPTVSEDERIAFELTVHDGELSDREMAHLFVRFVDDPPVAVATAAAEVPEREPVVLDGSASSDPEDVPLAYAWIQTEGPEVELDDRFAARPSFVAPEVVEDTALRFVLVVNDGFQESPDAEIVLTVKNVNRPPVATVDAAPAVYEGSVVRLSGAASDPDGDPVTVSWKQLGGPAVELAEATTLAPSFTAPPGDAVLSFALVASDGQVEGEPAVVDVVVRDLREDDPAPMPTKSAGASASSGCGCSSEEGSPAAVLPLLLAAFALRRRYQA